MRVFCLYRGLGDGVKVLVGGGVDGGVGRWMAAVWGLGAGGACLAVSSGQFTCGWQLAVRRRWAATRGARFRFASSSPLISLTSNPRRLGESWGRTSVREDCMKEFKEVGRIMNLRRLGESWKRKGVMTLLVNHLLALSLVAESTCPPRELYDNRIYACFD